MTPTANDPTEPISATRGEHGLAGAIKNLAYAAIRPLRYQMLYNWIVGDLAQLDDNTLCDIGLPRREIRSYAHSRAALRWPARHSLRAVLVGVATALWRALKRGRQRRTTIYDLMVLDDRMLKDIGLSRSQIPWVADEMVRSLSEFGMATMGRPPAVHDMGRVDDRTNLANRPSQGLVPSGANAAHRIATPANDSRRLKAS
jgi:uncharacterized protein YjiS (DUF1127 family)